MGKRKKDLRRFRSDRLDQVEDNMKVLHVANTFFPNVGGVETFIDEFSTLLVEAGHEVTILVPSSTKKLNLKRKYQIEYFNKEKFEFTKKRAYRFILDHILCTSEIISLVDKIKPDVVHFHSRNFFYASRKVRRKTPTMLLLHTTYFMHLRKKFWRKTLLNSFDVIITQTTQLEEKVKKMTNSKISKLPICIDTEQFNPNKRDQKYRTELGVKPEEIMILSVGRMVEYKGFTDLPKIISRLALEKLPIKMIFIGDGPTKNEIIRLIKKYEIQEITSIRTDVDQKLKKNIYASADIFVHPVRWGEAFGIVVLEALSSGVPVLSTKSSGPAEIITDNVDGLLAIPKDEESLYQLLKKLIQDKRLRKNISIKGREKALEKYSLKRYLEDYLKIVQEIKK